MVTFNRDGPIAARAAVAVLVRAVAAVVVGVTEKWTYAPATGWIAAAVVFLIWTWAVVARMTPSQTATHATRVDPTRVVTDVFILTASVSVNATTATASRGHQHQH